MKYYLIVVGRGKARRILTYFTSRQNAVLFLNRAILDLGYMDARLITSSIEPPKKLMESVR